MKRAESGNIHRSIPISESVAQIDVTRSGTGTATAASCIRFDLREETYHEGALLLEVKSINGQGGTPTSPGTSKTITVKCAFSNEPHDVADAPTVLGTAAITTVVCTLPNTDSSEAAGTRIHQSDVFIHRGRYLYFWYDAVAMADSNSSVRFIGSLIRI